MSHDLQIKALSMKDAGIYTGLSRSTLYRLITSAVLPSFKVRGRRLIRIQDLDSLLMLTDGEDEDEGGADRYNDAHHDE